MPYTPTGPAVVLGPANGTMVLNGQVISANYTIPTNFNSMSVGPITINTGVTVTVPDNSRWVII